MQIKRLKTFGKNHYSTCIGIKWRYTTLVFKYLNKANCNTVIHEVKFPLVLGYQLFDHRQ
jgi:hypothetical protein